MKNNNIINNKLTHSINKFINLNNKSIRIINSNKINNIIVNKIESN